MGADVAAIDDPKRARKAERRQQLLDAAVEAIRQSGPAATMEQLSRAGGVTKPILYRHFGDRDGLISAIGQHFAAELLSNVQSSLTGTEGRPASCSSRRSTRTSRSSSVTPTCTGS